MGTSECQICGDNEYLDEYNLEGKVLYVCPYCVKAALLDYVRVLGVI